MHEGICSKNKYPKSIAKGSSIYRIGLILDAVVALYAKNMKSCMRLAPIPSKKIKNSSYKFGVIQYIGTIVAVMIVVYKPK